jgi:chemotaxis protein CheX
MMLGFDVATSPPQLKQTKQVSGKVTGILGLSGDLKGTVTVSLSERAALFITGTLLGEEYDRVTPDVVDAIGELTNMLLGRARAEFELAGLHLSASLPIVVVGRSVEVGLVTKLPNCIDPVSLPGPRGE